MMKRLKTIFFYTVAVAVAVTGVWSNQQSFAVEPEDLSAVVDTAVSLPCRVTGLAGQLQWTKDDFALGTNRNLSYHGYPRYAMTGSDSNGEYNLKLNPVTLDDDGVYQCQVGTGKRDEPAIRSRKATLTVLVPPDHPRILSGESITVTENVPVELVCISDGGKPEAKVPRKEEEWKKIQNGFNLRWNFPNCVGALDGKHVVVKKPPGTGTEYFNYKNSCSIVLMASVDHDYCFRYVDIGAKGRQSDGGIFADSSLKYAIENNKLNLPKDAVFVADEAFPMKPYLMKPYARRNLTKEQKIFNYRLSRARRIVENAFGILTSRFRVYEKPISLIPEKVDSIVNATCALHNWLRIKSPNTYTPSGTFDYEDLDNCNWSPGSWRNEVQPTGIINMTSHPPRYPSTSATTLREKYTQYFNNEGAVPWQDKMIF